MLRHTFIHTVLGAVIAAVLLAPAALADGWAAMRVGLDPAIAVALQDRATAPPASVPLDTAIAVAISDRSSAEELALDPAIRTALADLQPTRPGPTTAHRPAARARCRSPFRPRRPTSSTGIGSASAPAPRSLRCSSPWARCSR